MTSKALNKALCRTLRLPKQGGKVKQVVTCVVISDTHMRHAELSDAGRLPKADVLLHCGDFAQRCPDETDLLAFNEWLGTLDQYTHKVVIAGNQEYLLNDPEVDRHALLSNATYLQDSAATVCGLKIYGSPWNTSRNMAFSCPRKLLPDKWELIPEDVDILLTHMPPYKMMDFAATSNQRHWGCEDLFRTVLRVRPRLHAFGHVHEGFGAMETKDDESGSQSKVVFVNAASSAGRHDPLNDPWYIEIEV